MLRNSVWPLILAATAAAQTTPVPTLEHAESLARRIDGARQTGELQHYDRLFAPLHPHAYTARRALLRRLLEQGSWAVESSIRDFGAIGDRGIALIDTVFRPRVPKERADPDDSIASSRYLVFMMSGDQPVGLIDADVNARALPKGPLTNRKQSSFGCSACNYVIRADQDWLVVPHVAEQVGCLEAISFYSLQCGASIDVSVHIGAIGLDPQLVLKKLLHKRGKQGDRIGSIHDWVPPHYSSDIPDGLCGVRAEVLQSDGHLARLHAAAFGPVLYLFTVQGGSKSVGDNHDSVEAVLDSFMLRETDIGKVRLSLRPVAAHTGGKFEDNLYRNKRVGRSFAGPTGWKPKMRCGAHLFHITYTCEASNDRIAVRALAPPVGRRRWTLRSAGWTLITGTKGHATKTDSGWAQNRSGGWDRDLVLESPNGMRRAIRANLDVQQQTLVLMDARTAGEDLGRLTGYFDALHRD